MVMNKAVWCYAEGQPGNWEAICLDFDLSVQGESFDQVYRDLHESILMYLDYIDELPKEEQAQFLNRQVPLTLRLKFISLLLLSAFKTGMNEKDRASFLVHSQA